MTGGCARFVTRAYKEEAIFWNFRDDIKPDSRGELRRWKNNSVRYRELFDWLPWGQKGRLVPVKVSSAKVESCEPVSSENGESTMGFIEFGPASVLLVEKGEVEKDEIFGEKVSRLCMPVPTVLKNEAASQEEMSPL